MNFGTWRGTPLALALATMFGLCVGSVRADGLIFQHTIPREVDAYDFTTGGAYKAPPVPYGHYAKDYIEELQKHTGCVSCRLHALMGGHGAGHSLFHHGDGDAGYGKGHGKCLKHGANCDGSGLDCGSGHGLFGHGHKGGAPIESGYPGYVDGGIGFQGGAPVVSGSAGYVDGGIGMSGGGAGFATTWAGASGQTTISPSTGSICGESGCNTKTKHSHFGHLLGAHGHGGAYGCGDPGCGLCAGAGHGAGKGFGHGAGKGCGFCGGRGCGHCLSALSSALHGGLASIAGAFHRPKVSWFLGAGGPVPLTPGYVPYIVTTRSPRDFFAFPPMNPNDP
jgi:hypothetical protein